MQMVRQDDHMVQCKEIAAYWGNGRFDILPRHDSAVRAIAGHDGGWTTVDDRLPFHEQKRRPVNFHEFAITEHARFYEVGYRDMLARDRYAALLIGLHWLGLYMKRYGNDPTLSLPIPEAYAADMQQLIERMEQELTAIKLAYWSPELPRRQFEDEVWMAYEWLQVMDRLSLFMSLHRPDAINAASLGKVRPTLQAEAVEIVVEAPGDGTLRVTPYPFATAFETTVWTSCIANIAYDDGEQAREAYGAAERQAIIWHVCEP